MNSTPISINALAEKVGAHAPSLYRVMRMLASVGLFTEGPTQQFALTPIGALLKTNAQGSLRYMAMLFGDEWTTRAYEHFADCVRTGSDGVTKAYGKHAFDLLAERPDQAEIFQRAMTNFQLSQLKPFWRLAIWLAFSRKGRSERDQPCSRRELDYRPNRRLNPEQG
jgi:hypothetical protein